MGSGKSMVSTLKHQRTILGSTVPICWGSQDLLQLPWSPHGKSQKGLCLSECTGFRGVQTLSGARAQQHLDETQWLLQRVLTQALFFRSPESRVSTFSENQAPLSTPSRDAALENPQPIGKSRPCALLSLGQTLLTSPPSPVFPR